MSALDEAAARLAMGLGLVAALGAVGRYILFSFHNENVKPAVDSLNASLSRITDATHQNTQALAKTNDTAERASQENRKAFEGIESLVADHETRISIAEVHLSGLTGETASRPRRSR